jgi:hypothetical protein
MNNPQNFLISRTSFRSTASASSLKSSNITGKNLKIRRNKALTKLKIMKITSPEPGITQSSTAESKNLSISQENTSAVDFGSLSLQLGEVKQGLLEVRSFGNECFGLLNKIIQQKKGKVNKSKEVQQEKNKDGGIRKKKRLIGELRRTMNGLSRKVENNECLLNDHGKNLEEIRSKIEFMMLCEKTQPSTRTESSCLIY